MSEKLSDYKLPVKAQESTKNFDSVQKKQWFSLTELKEGDYAGMTETDSKTSGKEDGQYTPINKKSGGNLPERGKKLGTTISYDKHTKVANG